MGIATEYAVAAIIAAKIGQGKKYFAGISDDRWLELRARALRGGEQSRQRVIVRSQQFARYLTRERLRTDVRQISSGCRRRGWVEGGHASLYHLAAGMNPRMTNPTTARQSKHKSKHIGHCGRPWGLRFPPCPSVSSVVNALTLTSPASQWSLAACLTCLRKFFRSSRRANIFPRDNLW